MNDWIYLLFFNGIKICVLNQFLTDLSLHLGFIAFDDERPGHLTASETLYFRFLLQLIICLFQSFLDIAFRQSDCHLFCKSAYLFNNYFHLLLSFLLMY